MLWSIGCTHKFLCKVLVVVIKHLLSSILLDKIKVFRRACCYWNNPRPVVLKGPYVNKAIYSTAETGNFQAYSLIICMAIVAVAVLPP